MHKRILGLGLAFVLALGGCGGDDKGGGSATDGGSGGTTGGTGGSGGTTGGTGGTTGGTGGSGGSSSGSCNAPKCVADLATSDCVPSGTCTQSISPTFTMINICYSNGVKMLTTISGMTATIRVVKANGTTCYSLEPMGMNTVIWKNGSGTQVATQTRDGMGNTIITCTGGQPVTINQQACENKYSTQTMGMSQMCAMGACM